MSDYFTGCEVCETNARTYGVMTAERKVDELEAEVARLRAEVADLKAAAQWRPMATAPRDGTWILVLMSPEPSGIYASASVLCFHNDPFADFWRNTHWDRFPELAGYGWLPIPALPEGGV